MKSNQSELNPRPLPATPRQSVFLSLSPSQRKPRPVASQWKSRPLQGPAATPLGPNARARAHDRVGQKRWRTLISEALLYVPD